MNGWLNLRMNGLTAAIGIEGIRCFDETFYKRKENMGKLSESTNILKIMIYNVYAGF